MSDTRGDIVEGIRQTLRSLRDEGVEVIGPRPDSTAATRPAAEPAPEQAAPPSPATARPTTSWQPRVAALAMPNADALSDEARAKAALLEEIRHDLGDCTRCELCETRSSIVFGEGHPAAPVVFVGEGPGAEEDRSGRPFVGRAGELLTKMIASVGWQREDVYICNIVKCRPPGNRDPRLEEVAMCQPFLERQLRAIDPVAIVTLGKPATSTLLGRPVAITRERGKWQEWKGFPVMPTFHPAYLLRNYTRDTRQAVWDDLKAVRARIDALE
jgi:DNA polymerase